MRHRPSATELLAWTLVGTAVGIVAGFALGQWLGPAAASARQRPSGAGEDVAGEPDPPAAVAELPGRASRALAADPGLAELGLTAVAVAPGILELHGWVPTRAVRARAARLVAATPGITTLVNCLLVHGEDDHRDPAPKPAPRRA